MDIIYSTLTEDIGVLKNFLFDFEANFSSDQANDFEVRLAQDNNCLEIGQYIYVAGTEYGGRIDKLKVITKTDEVFYYGRNWRALIQSKIIQPATGEPYYIVSGTVTEILSQIVEDFELDDIFSVKQGADVTISSYQFKRYVDAYTGIQTMLTEYDLKLKLAFNEQTRKCELWAEEVVDFSETQNITSDLYDFTFEKNKNHCNHLIGLGGGHLENRDIVHRYLDENNHISTTQHFFGADEVVEIYDYGNVENYTELVKATEKKLLEELVADKISLTTNNINADIGDKFSTYYEDYGIKTAQYISTIIVDVDDNYEKINYKAEVLKEDEKQEIENEIEIEIPTKTSELVNDSGYQTEEQVTEKIEESVPVNVSELVNDRNYQTGTQVEQSINEKIASVYRFVGSVPTYADLPSTDVNVGDVYDTQDTGLNYAWTGTTWDALGATISNLWNKDELEPIPSTTLEEILI